MNSSIINKMTEAEIRMYNRLLRATTISPADIVLRGLFKFQSQMTEKYGK